MKCPQKRDKLVLPIVPTNLMEQSKKKKNTNYFMVDHKQLHLINSNCDKGF